MSHYRLKQNIYTEGSPAHSLFYIQQGGVRLTTGSKWDASAVAAALIATAFWTCCPASSFKESAETDVLSAKKTVRRLTSLGIF